MKKWLIIIFVMAVSAMATEAVNITFDTHATIDSIGICTVSSDHVAIVWENSSNVILAVYNSTGSEKALAQVATGIGSYAVSLDAEINCGALTNETIVVGWSDHTNGDVSFRIYSFDGSSLSPDTGEIDVDIDVSTNYNAHIEPLSSINFSIAWYDRNGADNGAKEYAIYNENGTLQTGPFTVFTSGTTSYGMGITALEPDEIVVTYRDQTPGDASFEIVDEENTELVAQTDLDTDALVTYGVRGAAFSTSLWVAAWYDDQYLADGNDERPLAQVYNDVGVSQTSLLVMDDDDIGTSARLVEVGTANSTHFMVVWGDGTTDVQKEFAIYNRSGTMIAEKVLVASANDIGVFDVTSYNPNTNLSICDGNYFVAYSDNAGYLIAINGSDGNEWNGVCTPPAGPPGNVEPSFIYNNPPDDSLRLEGWNTLNITVWDPDANDTLNVTWTLNGTNSVINTSITTGTTVTINWSNYSYGLMNWTVTVTDAKANVTNGSRNFTANSYPVVNLLLPLNGNSTTDTTPDFEFNATDREGNQTPLNCELLIDGSGHGLVNVTHDTNTTITSNTSLATGTYLWRVACSDGFFQTNSSQRTIIIASSGTTSENWWLAAMLLAALLPFFFVAFGNSFGEEGT